MKVISTVLVLILVLGVIIAIPTEVGAAGSGTWKVDLGISDNQTGISIAGWGPIESDNSSASFGAFKDTSRKCRVTWEGPVPDDSLRCAQITYVYDECVAPARLTWRYLDGDADCSFEVYVNNILVYVYTDRPPIEDVEGWSVTMLDLIPSPLGPPLGSGTTQVVKFCAIGPAGSSFSSYGQNAIDWVELTTEEGSLETAKLSSDSSEPEPDQTSPITYSGDKPLDSQKSDENKSLGQTPGSTTAETEIEEKTTSQAGIPLEQTPSPDSPERSTTIPAWFFLAILAGIISVSIAMVVVTKKR